MTKPSTGNSLTPLMRQYHAIKEQHPDKILFFRMGDFYEMFGDDAVKAAPILSIALTSRAHGESERVPLAGVPYHSADKYLARLLAAGEKVVVVEQVEDPKQAKGIVKREIVEILTPGTATVESAENVASSPCLAAVYPDGKAGMGLAALDLTTGSFVVDEGPIEDIVERLKVLEPAEVLCPANIELKELAERLGFADGQARLTPFGEWNFDTASADRDLNQHFGTTTLEGFGVVDSRRAVGAAGAVFRYLRENHRDRLAHINRLTRFDDSEYMHLDYSSVRNLELIRSIATGGEEHSLFAVINHTQTQPGARRLRSCLLRPFKNKTAIERRLSGVAELLRNHQLNGDIRRLTKGMPDLEKLAGRLGIGKLNPRQAGALKDALITARQLRELLHVAAGPLLTQVRGALPNNDDIITMLDDALAAEPPLVANKGDIFKRGYWRELDELNDSIREARLYIASLQEKERQNTGIGSLKVGFNKVFGYYLEITKANLDRVPSEYIRKQTLVNAERYITPELKDKEALILSAEENIFRLEEQLYLELLERLEARIGDIISTSDLLAELDLVSSLATLAVTNSYCRPEIFEDCRLVIRNGRHPVIETVLEAGGFVANDAALAADGDRIHILTGPNMSGKSTFVRQLGLIVILAQIGSFVPAESAQIGLVDRVFTRVGALDNLTRGQSTFLVEMVETANIMHNATERSLILLDEVGRGTSTFDGLSVAWAVAEYINEKIGARTIFATHYHELTSLATIYPTIRNFQVAVRKWEDRVVFLHQIIPGGCDDSYGIEVAKLAGLPKSSISRARQVLRLLESGKFNQSELGAGIYKERVQPTLFDRQPSKVEKMLDEVDPDRVTPMEALAILRRLKDERE